MPVAHGHPRVGARYMWTGQDGAVGPLLRMGLEPRRLASGAVLGVVIGLISLLPLASEEGPKAVGYVGVALMVALTAPWILSVLYLRTERGQAARDEHQARKRESRGH
jgi:hypothetical protein